MPTIPDLGRTPRFLAGGAAGSAAGTQLAASYNTALFNGLAASGLRVIPLDTFTLIDEITTNPTAYGFTNATDAACSVSSSVTCSPLDYVTPTAAADYIFADGVHPSAAAHEVLSQCALSVLEGPRQVAVLTHSATISGYSRAERVAMARQLRDLADGHPVRAGHLQPRVRRQRRHGLGASLQTIPGALPYAVPGVEFNQDYGVCVVGARAGGRFECRCRYPRPSARARPTTPAWFISLGGSF